MTAPIWRPLDQLQRQRHGCYPCELYLDRSLVSGFLTLWDRTSMHQMSLLYALMSCERSSQKHWSQYSWETSRCDWVFSSGGQNRETLRRNDLALVRKKEWRRESRVVPGEIKLREISILISPGGIQDPDSHEGIPEFPKSLDFTLTYGSSQTFSNTVCVLSVSMSVSVWYYRSSSVCLNVSVTVSVMLQIIIRVSVMLQIIISVTECHCQCDVTDHHQSDWMSV